MTGPLKHKTSHPQVDVQVAGGDDTQNRASRCHLHRIGPHRLYRLFWWLPGQMAQFWGAMASVKGGWLFVACFFMFCTSSSVFRLRDCRVVSIPIRLWAFAILSPLRLRAFSLQSTPMMMGSARADLPFDQGG